jgi:hypothetical protein
VRSSPESVSPRSPGGLRTTRVSATVPADVGLCTINFQDDYSFFLFLAIGVNHSTIRSTEPRLFACRHRALLARHRHSRADRTAKALAPEGLDRPNVLRRIYRAVGQFLPRTK